MLNQNHHVPVLLNEVLQYLDPSKGESYLDLTAGYGGHAEEVLKKTKTPKLATLVDRDAKSVQELRAKFGDQSEIVQSDFLEASRQLLAAGKQFDNILADLGVSSPHLDNASRGFSLKAEGPLDMRMDQSQELTAADIVNKYSLDQLADILHRYGEEPKARKIAKTIISNRPVTTTTQLAQIVARISYPTKQVSRGPRWQGKSKVHPATRTFQALRIAVNDELAMLEQALPVWLDLLKPGGRIAIISFHSLEDRIVKQALADRSGNRYDSELKLLTKSPITASDPELVSNPRARSAKLRAAAKIKI